MNREVDDTKLSGTKERYLGYIPFEGWPWPVYDNAGPFNCDSTQTTSRPVVIFQVSAQKLKR